MVYGDGDGDGDGGDYMMLMVRLLPKDKMMVIFDDDASGTDGDGDAPMEQMVTLVMTFLKDNIILIPVRGGDNNPTSFDLILENFKN